jgi:hypothetical protein
VQLAQHSSLLPPLSMDSISSDGHASYDISTRKSPFHPSAFVA